MAVNDLTSNVDSTYPDDPSDSSVQVHQADHDEIHDWLKTAGDISSNVLTTSSVLDDLNDVVETTITSGDLLRWNGTSWVNYADSNFASSGHSHATGDITSGTFANARISQSSVTQHESALTITESQISDLDHYTTSDFNTDFAASNIQSLGNVTITSVTNDEVLAWNGSAWVNQTAAEAGLSAASHSHATGDITSGTFANARIAQSNVTQHEAALTIAESQISDLDHLTIEEVQDNLGTAFLVQGTDISLSYDDGANTLTISSTATGVTDHGALTGLGDDDHTQYLNNTRHNSLDHSTAMGTVVLNDISDVTETTITTGDVLRWNGSAWVNYADSGYATSGHGHTSGNISDFAEATSDQVGSMVSGNTETGITVTYQDADNTLDFAVAYGSTPPSLAPDIAGASGSANTASRSDHVHNVPAATAVGISNSSTNAEGNSTSFARANHTHAVTGFALTSHNHSTANITSGTFADVRIAQSNVTQHQAALSITESQISDLDHLTIEEVQDNLGTAFIVGGTNLTATYSDAGNTLTLDVDTHTHTESQVTDLDHLTLEEVQDNLGTGFIVGGTDITVTYSDVGNTLTIDSTATGVTDHGALTGLGDDDHTQYLNNTRHNALDHSTALGTTVLADISDVTETTITSGDVLRWNGSAWVNYADSNFASSSHNHAAGDVNSGTFDNARISQSSVTQHQAALTITESQISDLDHYTTSDANSDIDARVTKTFVDALNVDADTLDGSDSSAFATSGHGHNHDSLTGFVADEHIDWTSDQGATNIHANNITGYSATGHGHTESDISDLDHYTTTDFNTDFGGRSTTNLSEGTNLYYTTARANSAIDARVTNSFVDALNVDADTVDGSHASDFATSSHNHNHDSLTGFVADEHIDWTTDQGATNIHANNITGYSTTGHGHTESDISDLDHLTIEEVQDNLGTSFIIGGDSLTVTYSDVGNTLTLDVDTGDFATAGHNHNSTYYTESEVDSLLSGKANTSHNHATGDITSGTFVDARIAQSNVTQHQAALSITESQISDLDHYTSTDFTADHGGVSGSHVTNGNSHNHSGGDGAQIDHGALGGLSDDDHTQYLNNTRHNSLDHSTAMGTVVLEDISDVTETTITSGDLLRWNGSAWVNYADSNYATSGHGHTSGNISDFAEAVSDQVGTMVTGNTESGITVVYQDGDNTLDFTVAYGTPVTLNPDAANSAGSGSTAARANHVHNVPADTAVGISNSSTNTEGNSTSFARANHTHAVTGFATTSHNHAAADTTSGTFIDARIAQSNVTQHQAALSITESQISDLDHYTSSDFTTDHNGVSGGHVTNGNSHNHAGGDGAQIDHGGLAGTGDDDHTIYSLASGARAFTGTVSGIEPTADAHLATKKYIDTLVGADTFLLMGA